MQTLVSQRHGKKKTSDVMVSIKRHGRLLIAVVSGVQGARGGRFVLSLIVRFRPFVGVLSKHSVIPLE